MVCSIKFFFLIWELPDENMCKMLTDRKSVCFEMLQVSWYENVFFITILILPYSN